MKMAIASFVAFFCCKIGFWWAQKRQFSFANIQFSPGNVKPWQSLNTIYILLNGSFFVFCLFVFILFYWYLYFIASFVFYIHLMPLQYSVSILHAFDDPFRFDTPANQFFPRRFAFGCWIFFVIFGLNVMTIQ